jgi:predicted transcriptional regulator
MAAVKSRSGVDLENKLNIIYKMDAAGHRQVVIAKAVGLTQAAVCYHLKNLANEMKAQRIAEREAKIDKRIATLQLICQEAYDAWERSKQDATMTKQEHGLVKVYDEVEGKRVVVGEELTLVKVIDSIEGRLPGCEYLQVMRQATMDIAKLQGLFEDVTVHNTNTQVNIGWDTLHARAVSPPGGPPAIEVSAKVADAPSDPSAEVVESPVDDIEVLEMDEP